jgi:hypothetical protein
VTAERGRELTARKFANASTLEAEDPAVSTV